MTTWTKLEMQFDDVKDRNLIDLFKENSNRFDEFSVEFGDLLMDYSKTNIDHDTMATLFDLAESVDLETKRNAMFSGDKINMTEGRAVLHTALRYQGRDPILFEGQDVMPAVRSTLDRMRVFSNDIRNGVIQGATGKAFTDVVNIGIGGSDLGPVMAAIALGPYADGPNTHFISNIDGAHIHDILAPLDPETTLVIVASKTFTTIETMTNAATAKAWLDAALGAEEANAHLAALSTAEEKTSAFGIWAERVFGFEDWVGGRYSVWGPIGLSVMLAIGPDHFDAFLQGAYDMDQHFLKAPLNENLPVIMALVGVWHSNICGYSTRAVLPYGQRLSRFPAYLQQLDMESNGKSVTMDGDKSPRNTGPIVWGEPGTNGQHAFYQLIHQGTRVIPTEFLLARKGHEANLTHQHDLFVTNCLAQSEALMIGRGLDTAREIAQTKGFEGAELEKQAMHRVFPGNRPSITMMYNALNPYRLGSLIALYEHRVFCEGVIWGINSFDQWGVELGKELAVELLPAVQSGDVPEGKDGSTKGLIAALRSH